MADRKELADGSIRRRISALIDINRYATSTFLEKDRLEQCVRESADLFRSDADLGGEEAMTVKYDCDVLYLRGGKAFSAVATTLSSTGIQVDYNKHIGVGDQVNLTFQLSTKRLLSSGEAHLMEVQGVCQRSNSDGGTQFTFQDLDHGQKSLLHRVVFEELNGRVKQMLDDL
ncbi:MAG: PilZ domain-containing protein [Myxococcota bacterium]|nr:PilZ domain-containing protein [Myxococcota bacterium]